MSFEGTREEIFEEIGPVIDASGHGEVLLAWATLGGRKIVRIVRIVHGPEKEAES